MDWSGCPMDKSRFRGEKLLNRSAFWSLWQYIYTSNLKSYIHIIYIYAYVHRLSCIQYIRTYIYIIIYYICIRRIFMINSCFLQIVFAIYEQFFPSPFYGRKLLDDCSTAHGSSWISKIQRYLKYTSSQYIHNKSRCKPMGKSQINV